MTAPCGGGHHSDKQLAFWERMANSYPHPFDPKSLADTNRIIALVEKRGVRVDHATILDIGCGTGNYSLPLASRATQVIGIDSSAAMLTRLEVAAAAQGVGNVRTLRTSWKEADIDLLGMEKGFDVVWAAMTPAVRDLEDIEKMHRFSQRWCVYIGWGAVRKNELMAEICAAHGLSYDPPPGAARVRSILAGQGIETVLDLVTTTWERVGGVEEISLDATGFIEAFGGTAQPALIREIVARHGKNGLVRHQTEAEKGVLAWRVA